MRVLIGCERFGKVREAFRRQGHDAWSCDLEADADGSPFHWRGDVLELLENTRSDPEFWPPFDLGIFHPPCTYLTVAAAWAFGDGPYHQKVKPGTLVGAARRKARAEAFDFFMACWNAPIPKVAIENPVGMMSTLWRPADQIIHPNQFGDDASKATCLWLRNLPKLTPTKQIAGRIVEHNGRRVERWSNQTDSGQNRLPPSPDRAALRAATYPGIAAAFAAQWGSLK